MRLPLSTARRIRKCRGVPWAAALVLVCGATVAVLFATARGDSAETRSAKASAGAAVVRRDPRPVRLVERSSGRLRSAVQDAAAAPIGGARILLLGGLTASDTSRADVLSVGPRGDSPLGVLPAAVHDAAAVRIGGNVYLFGGGTNANAQSDAIVRVSIRTGKSTVVGRLPAPSSDQAAAMIGGTAYVVGGYTGKAWLDTVVAWRPGSPARVVARLPFALRYAAVAAVGHRLVIAGGSLENGSASRAVLAYTLGGRVVRVGNLPAPTTHAAAASVGPVVYVIGGRGAARDSLSARIVAIDAATGRIRSAGSLAHARSDLAAVATGDRIRLAGGREASGAVSALTELASAPPAPKRSVALAATPENVYAHAGKNMLSGAARSARPLVYVPNSESNAVDVIDPRTYKIIAHFAVGGLPQHVVPAWNLKTLFVTNDTGNSLTPIDPATGKPRGATIPVDDPYNMYFTPDGRYAIVVAERLHRLAFRDAHGFRLHHSLSVPCAGVDHMDFTANGRFLLASCEFSRQLVVVNVAQERVVRTITLPAGRGGMPQDVKLSPDGAIFYVADMQADGVWEIDAHSYRIVGFLATGAGAHGLYPSRDGKRLYVSNRGEGSISVVSFRTRKQVAKWRIPGGGSPDMGGVSADGKTLWLAGRYNAEVYAISTRSGQLLARIHIGAGPHGLCIWPQPGRYSLGHTGILR